MNFWKKQQNLIIVPQKPAETSGYLMFYGV